MNQLYDTEYRVIQMTKPLRNAMRKYRDENQLTNQEFVAEAVEKNLPKLVAHLKAGGFVTSKGELGPTRIPFSIEKGTLGELAKACESTGIPMVRLLTICISNASSPKKRQSRRRKQKR